MWIRVDSALIVINKKNRCKKIVKKKSKKLALKSGVDAQRDAARRVYSKFKKALYFPGMKNPAQKRVGSSTGVRETSRKK